MTDNNASKKKPSKRKTVARECAKPWGSIPASIWARALNLVSIEADETLWRLPCVWLSQWQANRMTLT